MQVSFGEHEGIIFSLLTKSVRILSPRFFHHSVNFYFTVESVPSLNIFARSIFILPTSQNRHSSHAETIPATIIIMAVWKYVNMKFGVKIYSSKRLSLLFAVCICPLHKKSAFIDYQKAGHRHTAPMARLRPILGSYFLPAT